MHETRATSSWRGRLALAVALFLAVLTLFLLTQRRIATRGAAGVDRAMAAPSSSQAQSAAENARRAAIAALGPIKRRQGTNAADLYKQAIGLYAALTDEEKRMLMRRRDKLDPKVAATLYAKIQPIMNLLRRARTADYVDWGFGPITSFTDPNLSANLHPTQDLAFTALWDATYRFQSDPDGAVSDLAAMEAMSRSGVNSLIGLLVEDGVHANGLAVLAQNAASITAVAGPDLADIVNSAVLAQAFQTGMNSEASILQASLDQYADPATRSGSFIQKFAGSYNDNGGITPQEAASETQWLMQTEQQFGATLTEPDAQFQQWWSQKVAQAAPMPLASMALPNFPAARTATLALMVENAMMNAGLAIEQSDQAQFQSISDPTSGHPFTYTQTADGFQLTSALLRGGKPVTLSFSTPAPQ